MNRIAARAVLELLSFCGGLTVGGWPPGGWVSVVPTPGGSPFFNPCWPLEVASWKIEASLLKNELRYAIQLNYARDIADRQLQQAIAVALCVGLKVGDAR